MTNKEKEELEIRREVMDEVLRALTQAAGTDYPTITDDLIPIIQNAEDEIRELG